MPLNRPDFRHTWLWQHVFVKQRQDALTDEQEFFANQLLHMREKVGHLVSRIASDMPGMTVHDLTHLDALWETASIVAEGAISVSPPEGFVFGASVLLHDAGLTIAAYPNGTADIEKTLTWKDSIARWQQSQQDASTSADDLTITPELRRQLLPDVLRRLHAEQAEVLATQSWRLQNGEQQFLIDDCEVRGFYGKTIGEIAHSHWWNIERVEHEFANDIGAFPARTRNLVDRVKLASLLRIADALHLDLLRAPRFERALTRPEGTSALHWSFQEKLARPHIESDAIVFTTGQPFSRLDADAWWLAYDTLCGVDRELKTVDVLLHSRGREALRARRVKGIESPEALAKTVQTRDWRPIDARIRVTDVPRIVEALGGAKLYGDDPLVPLRELIQNAADAVQARRRLQNRPADWGEIRVWIESRENEHWLIVEDNGIGMSELVLTGPLLDFGTSFWQSSLIMDEFPGLVAAGMRAIGRFGIGFFSVFMLGQVVRVISKRFDRGIETARVLEIRGGPGGRQILWPAVHSETPLDGGTRVEVQLAASPSSEKGILANGGVRNHQMSLDRVVAGLAPSLEVCLATGAGAEASTVVRAGDWLNVPEAHLLSRLDMTPDTNAPSATSATLLRQLIGEDGKVLGRLAVWPESYFNGGGGWVTVSGLRANRMSNVRGILAGEATTAARDAALPIVPKEILAAWATEQAQLIMNHRIDLERKAMAAETILECGGSIHELPIVRWDNEWLSMAEFKTKIAECAELVINFDGDFTYDEDQDPMHPQDFKNDFEESSTVITVPRHSGSIVKTRGFDWPACLFPDRDAGTRLSHLVMQIVSEAWDQHVDETEERRVVGTAGGLNVERDVTVLMRSSGQDGDKFEE